MFVCVVDELEVDVVVGVVVVAVDVLVVMHLLHVTGHSVKTLAEQLPLLAGQYPPHFPTISWQGTPAWSIRPSGHLTGVPAFSPGSRPVPSGGP